MKFFECVPNFSEGRDANIISRVVEAASQVSGVQVLDIESNADHNRSVLTLIGPGEALKEAAFRATRKAAELIDLTKHTGQHPRMGAMDVVPFIPMGDATMEEASSLAAALGERVWKELSIPVFLYGKAARIPERMDLALVRKGEFEGLREVIGTDQTRNPDIGLPKIHPTAGAIAIGARPVLIAYNIYLNTTDVGIAKKVAHAVRARDGGLAEVKALGFEIKERNLTQVSINMTDYTRTPIHRVFEMVRVEALRYGVGIVESEIVGLIPDDALVDAALHYLQLNGFDRRAILERKLFSREGEYLKVTTLSDYLSALSDRTPTPGGGSASALVAALGTALGEMVVRYSGPQGSLSSPALHTIERLSVLRKTLSESVEDDSRAYDGVRAARKRMKNMPGDENARKDYHKALERAANVPLSIARGAVSARELIEEAGPLVKETLRSDHLAALSFLEAARAGAVANVEINIVSLKEEGVSTTALEEAMRNLNSPTSKAVHAGSHS